MLAPSFWTQDGLVARVLSPFSAIGAAMTARRVARPGWTAPVPVICCGNATVGGAGKTTLVLDLARRLTARRIEVHTLLRGRAARVLGAHRVTVEDAAVLVGDEALLQQEVAPTWTGVDRSVSARAAIAAGAQVLLMDDGLQNPTLQKTFSILVIDGTTGFGNGRVLPAGPLREPVSAAAERCQAAVLIGPDLKHSAALLPERLPVLRAELRQDDAIARLVGRKVVAFAGIAFPEKFFAPLRAAGVEVVKAVPYPDHHFYTPRDTDELAQAARETGAILVTTPKDSKRLPPVFLSHCTVVGVSLEWQEPEKIEHILDKVVEAVPANMP